MKYKYCEYNADFFATALRQDKRTKNLIWDNAQGQSVIIIQTPFGDNAESLMPDICQKLSECELRADGYTEIQTGVCVRIVTASEKARNNGCQINGEASTYTVFGCSVEGDITRIYEPKNQAMISSNYDVPLEMYVSMTKETRMEGFFRKKEIDTGYYQLKLPSELSESYIDGSVSYIIGKLNIPITKRMLKQGTIYIKTQIRPELVSNNKGLRLV